MPHSPSPAVSNSFAKLPNTLFSQVSGSALPNPEWLHINHSLGDELGLNAEFWDSDTALQIMSAGQALPDGISLAMKYCGHQFGVFNPDLGDGRGLLLGEITAQDGKLWDLHLKGAGQTPYSRGADGRAVLRSSIREYLCSHAMHGLGIATTQALCLVRSSEGVQREQREPAAAVCRVARSHIRFGHFEYLRYSQQKDTLRELADYVIARNFSDKEGINADENAVKAGDYTHWFQQIVKRTALMLADWQAIGFAHGVMNTDNMSIIGDTFDYGPFAFLDDFDPGYICNHSDYNGRYAFNRQPGIALWNLQVLANALQDLIPLEALQAALESYESTFQQHYTQTLRAKLGLHTEYDGDVELLNATLNMLAANALDYTRFMRALPDILLEDQQRHWHDQCRDTASFEQWFLLYRQRINAENLDNDARRQAMNAVNPKYILRNYLAQQAIEQATQGDYQRLNDLLQVLNTPYEEHPAFEAFATASPDWGKQLAISCSS